MTTSEPKLTYDYWGTTGMGRRRTIDGDGNVVNPPKPWHKQLGVLALNVFFWGVIGLSVLAMVGMVATLPYLV